MEKKLRHFETTNKVHRWTPPAPPPSTIATRAPTSRSAYGAGTQQQQARRTALRSLPLCAVVLEARSSSLTRRPACFPAQAATARSVTGGRLGNPADYAAAATIAAAPPPVGGATARAPSAAPAAPQ